MPKPRTRAENAVYMREYRARKRAEATTAATVDVQDLAALAEPSAADPDVVTLPVRLDDAQFAKLAGLMRAVEARHGAKVTAPAAMRLAVEVAHRAIVAD